MKKTYIAPIALEHKIGPVNMIAESLVKDDTVVDGGEALMDEDYGILDDEDDENGIWGSWKKTW